MPVIESNIFEARGRQQVAYFTLAIVLGIREIQLIIYDQKSILA
jgi:hypothetical protein